MYPILLAAVGVASAFDLRSHEIPNWISVVVLLVALLFAALGLAPAGWTGVALGSGVALLVSIPAFAIGALGGGDVKLLGALGAALGPVVFLPFLMITAVAGGLLALLARARSQTEVAYAPAMAIALVLLPLLPYLAESA